MNCTLTNFIARVRVVSLFAFAMCAAVSAEARSITGVERIVSPGAMSLSVTFEAGESGDAHALYIAYDTEDKGDDIANWVALQRGCVVADDATSATIPVSPLLTAAGYKVCRVFLTTSAAPYDTQIEYLRQSGTQYIDTGIKPDGTSVAVMDTKFDSNATRQQRFFGISSGDDATAEFSFDCYINGSGKFASACKDGKGDWKEAAAFTANRVRISLSAKDKHRIVITNLVTGTQIVDATRGTTCSKTSIANLLVFALHTVKSSVASIPTDKIAQGARLYSFSITTNSVIACDYKPCKLGDRVGVYDAVTDTVIYSASGTDFDAENSGSPVACSLLAGETQLAAAPSASGLFFDYTWRGTAANWGDTDAWTKEGDPATWVEGNNAIFATANATATLSADVTANAVAFNADATIATNGTDEATLAVKSVSVDSGVAATIYAPTASALDKRGAGTLTLAANRTDATIVTAGILKMDGATVAGLTLGTDGGAPVTFDYGGQELVKNTRDYLVTGSTVTLTNGTFSTPSGDDLNIRDDTFTMPSVLTIAKDAVVRQGAIGKSVYIVNVNGTATINVIGGTLGNTDGCKLAYLQHKSPDGGLNLNVSEGGLVYFPCLVYALCRGDIAATSPSLYMTFANSAFSVGAKFQFGSSYGEDSHVPTAPTGVFAATNSVVSVGDGFIVGRDTRDSKTAGSLTVDFENCVVTAKTFAVYYDRPLNNARFNGTRFVFGAASGSFAASDDAANWITVGAGGLTLDTQNFSATLNANLGGSGTVTKVGTGTLTVSRDQATTGGMIVDKGTLAINSSVTFAGPVAFAAGSALDIAGYDGSTSVVATSATLPAEGSVNLTLNGGAFGKGVYAIFAAPGLTAADGGKFAPLTGDLGYSWSVADDTLLLTVGDVSGNCWIGRGGDGRMSTAANWLNGAPAAGEDIDLSFVSSATTIIADTGRAFGAVTMGDGVITFTNSLAATSISDTSKVAVAADSTVTLEGDLVIDTTSGNKYIVNSVADGGKFKVTGKIRAIGTNNLWPSYVKTCNGAIEASGLVSAVSGSDLWSFRLSNSGGHIGKWIIGKDGFVCDERAAGFWVHNNSNDRTEIQAAADFTIQDAWIGLSKKASTFTIQTTSPDGIARTITAKTGFAAHADGACNLDVCGSGTFLCDYTAQAFGNGGPKAFSGAITVKDTATLAVNPEKYPTTGAISVSNESTFKVAQSGVVTLSGNLSLADGAALGFNFTNRKVGPLLALASGKSLSFVGEGEKNIAIKVSGDVWPVGGKHILTATGGFNAEGVTVSLAKGAPKWAKGVYVNEDGNIVLDVKPMGTKVIVR